MYDLILKNCIIVDGTGAPQKNGDIAIKNGKIADVGIVSTENAEETIDCSGLYAVPGFIDIHSHSDDSILKYPLCESRVFQGVTTEFGGNCGLSPLPDGFKKFLDTVEDAGASTNFGLGVGHGSLREAAMGYANRKPDELEMKKMKTDLVKVMEEGAYFISSGLIYPPGCYADADEIAELIREIKPYGAYYATHMRNEGDNVVESVKEAIKTAKDADVPLEISHHKVITKKGWQDYCFTTTKMIEEAKAEGMDIMCDQYPYSATATGLDSNIPSWGFEGGMEAMLKRLENPETRKKLRDESDAYHLGRWHEIVVSYTGSKKNSWTVGKNIVEIAKIMGKEPVDACFDLVYEEKGNIGEIGFSMCEEDVEYIMKKPYVVIGSDGSDMSFDAPGMPHPRNFGSFTRVLEWYCRERKLFTIEEAIAKMTGNTAKRLGLTDRGLIKEGMWADVVVIDFNGIKSNPTFEYSKCGSDGISKVFVNGILTVDNGHHTGVKAGKVLRKNH